MFEIGAKFEDGWISDNKKKGITPKLQNTLSPAKHQLKLRKEKRRGKIVTICGSFSLDSKQSKELLSSLKKDLGVGGTIRGDEMEFQGECGDKLKLLLQKRGFHFKK